MWYFCQNLDEKSRSAHTNLGGIPGTCRMIIREDTFFKSVGSSSRMDRKKKPDGSLFTRLTTRFAVRKTMVAAWNNVTNDDMHWFVSHSTTCTTDPLSGPFPNDPIKESMDDLLGGILIGKSLHKHAKVWNPSKKQNSANQQVGHALSSCTFACQSICSALPPFEWAESKWVTAIKESGTLFVFAVHLHSQLLQICQHLKVKQCWLSQSQFKNHKLFLHAELHFALKISSQLCILKCAQTLDCKSTFTLNQFLCLKLQSKLVCCNQFSTVKLIFHSGTLCQNLVIHRSSFALTRESFHEVSTHSWHPKAILDFFQCLWLHVLVIVTTTVNWWKIYANLIQTILKHFEYPNCTFLPSIFIKLLQEFGWILVCDCDTEKHSFAQLFFCQK